MKGRERGGKYSSSIYREPKVVRGGERKGG